MHEELGGYVQIHQRHLHIPHSQPFIDEEVAFCRSQDDVVKDQRLEAKDHDTDKRNDKH